MAWCILLIDTHTHLANWCTCWISVSPHASAEMHGYFEKNRAAIVQKDRRAFQWLFLEEICRYNVAHIVHACYRDFCIGWKGYSKTAKINDILKEVQHSHTKRMCLHAKKRW